LGPFAQAFQDVSPPEGGAALRSRKKRLEGTSPLGYNLAKPLSGKEKPGKTL